MDISEYNEALEAEHREICSALALLIAQSLPQAEGRVWHGHPVWFIEQNPVVGYSVKKAGVQALFWSGQSFATPGLSPLGKFKAASLDIPSLDSLSSKKLGAWLQEAGVIQWDYKNLPKFRELKPLSGL